MRYGFDFQFGVYEIIMKLCSDNSNQEFTITEVLNLYVKKNELDPDRSYKSTLRNRVWRFLQYLVSTQKLSVEHRKHSKRNNLIGYYKLNKA